MCRGLINPYRKKRPTWSADIIRGFQGSEVKTFHNCLPDYRPTPLKALSGLAQQLSIGSLYVKDEAPRFGLKAFKVLGASYAIYRFLKQQWGGNRGRPFDIKDFLDDGALQRLKGFFTFCTATDGNHGRAVAWTARQFGQKAVIYMPAGPALARVKNIESEGARVRIVDGEYDEAVRRAAQDSEANNWVVISDTAYPGYTEIPRHIMAGYITMFGEMETELHRKRDPGVDMVFLQGGVGSFAAAAVWYYVNRYGRDRPRLICVEPTQAACLFESAASKDGRLTRATGNFQTIMAGLNCGTPSIVAWPILREGIDAFIIISDDYAREGMRRYYHPPGNDHQVISGEAGAAGLGGLLALLKEPALDEIRRSLGIDVGTRILIFNTEGDTDPDNFQKIVEERPDR